MKSGHFSFVSWKQDRGVVAVELVLVILAFFALVIGLVDVSRAVFSYNALSAVARDATRHAIVRGDRASSPATAADIETYVKNKLVAFDDVTVSTTWTPDNRPGSKVSVTVTSTYNPVVALFPSTQLSATSQMAISY